MKHAIKLATASAIALLGGVALCTAQQPAAPDMQPPAIQQPPAPQPPQAPGPGMPGDARQLGPASGPMHGQGEMGMEHQPPRPPAAPDRDQLKKAGATDAQIQALSDLDFAQQSKRIDLQAELQKAELLLGHQMQAATVDEKAVLAAVAALNEARGELFKLEITTQLKVRQTLGEETMRKLREMGPPMPPRTRDQQASGMGPQHAAPPPANANRARPDTPQNRNEGPRPPLDGGR